MNSIFTKKENGPMYFFNGIGYRCLIAKFTLYVLVVFDNHMTTVGDSDWFYFVLQQDVVTGWVDGLKKTN